MSASSGALLYVGYVKRRHSDLNDALPQPRRPLPYVHLEPTSFMGAWAAPRLESLCTRFLLLSLSLSLSLSAFCTAGSDRHAQTKVTAEHVPDKNTVGEEASTGKHSPTHARANSRTNIHTHIHTHTRTPTSLMPNSRPLSLAVVMDVGERKGLKPRERRRA